MFPSKEARLKKNNQSKPCAEVEICSLKARADHLKEGQIVAVFLNPRPHNKEGKVKEKVKK